MSDQTLTPETALTVASTFLAYYYSEFVKLNELARMSDLYDERSYMTLVDFRDEVPVVAHGRNAVANLLAKLDGSLGQRKVEIITVDTVALPHNCVQVICQGVMYLREYRRVFLHVFVLEPTAYRTKTYHISSDYLRFVDSEKEVVPDGAVVIAADQVAHYLEESRRRIEEEQRRQLLEFQQRIRAQQEAAQARAAAEAKAKAEAEAMRAKAEAAAAAAAAASAAAAVRIPQPASRQGHGQGQGQEPRGPAEAREQRRERPERGERPPRDRREGHGDRRPERPERGERGERGPRNAGEERGDRAERRPREPRAEDGRPERKPREPREPRGGRKPAEGEKPAAAAAAAAGGAGAAGRPVEGGDRRKKPSSPPAAAAEGSGNAAAAAAAPAAERKPRRETGPTAACILMRVPKKIKLSDIKTEWVNQGGAPPDDMFWCGPRSAHAVLKFDSVEKATALYAKKAFAIQDESIAINYYHE